MEDRDPVWVVAEVCAESARFLRFVHCLVKGGLTVRIVPTIFQPGCDLTGRSRRRTQLWTSHLEHKVWFAGFCPDGVLGNRGHVQARRTSLDGRMRWEGVKPQAPKLTIKVPGYRVAVLVECL